MYIEHINTPHVSEGRAARPMVEALSSYTPGHEPLAAAAEARMTAARLAVRASLRWPSEEHQPQPGQLSMESMQREQITGCLGYTALLSEAMGRVAVPHFIGFGNTHAFVVGLDEQGNGFYQDAMFNGLSGPLSGAIGSGVLAQARKQVTKNGRSAVFLNTRQLVSANRRHNGTFDDVKQDYPWLWYEGNTRLENDNLSYQRYGMHDAQPGHRFVVSLYSPKLGQTMLTAMDRYFKALHTGEFQTAATSLHALRGIYPEMDARQKHIKLQRLTAGLISQGHPDMARQAVKDYFSSFDISQDPRFAIERGDVLRTMARQVRDPSLAQAALRAYKTARNCKYGAAMVEGKIRKAEDLVLTLS